MQFHITCVLGLLACSVSALPTPQEQNLPLRRQDGQSGSFNTVQKRAEDDGVVETRTPKILTDSKGNKFDDSIFIVDGQLIACPPRQQC